MCSGDGWPGSGLSGLRPEARSVLTSLLGSSPMSNNRCLRYISLSLSVSLFLSFVTSFFLGPEGQAPRAVHAPPLVAGELKLKTRCVSLSLSLCVSRSLSLSLSLSLSFLIWIPICMFIYLALVFSGRKVGCVVCSCFPLIHELSRHLRILRDHASPTHHLPKASPTALRPGMPSYGGATCCQAYCLISSE